jgi:hypothetical protein
MSEKPNIQQTFATLREIMEAELKKKPPTGKEDVMISGLVMICMTIAESVVTDINRTANALERIATDLERRVD